MYLRDLFEAPISDISHIGNWEKNSSYREQDRKLLTSPKAVAKIKSMWKYPRETMFNIILINHPDANKHTEVGQIDHDWLEKNMPRVFPQIEPLLKDDEINILYTNNKGAERVPMTGWIMAHRLGHALYAYHSRGKGAGYYFNEAHQDFERTTLMVLKHYGIAGAREYGWGTTTRSSSRLDVNGPTLGFLREVCTFKSARDHNIRNPYEVTHECLAQYMLTGKIVFKNIPKHFKYGNSYYGFRKNPNAPEAYEYMNVAYQSLADMMVENFENALVHSEGMILVM
jgi:hypothetical protein